MLLALRNYLAKERCVSLKQISRAFQVDIKALEPMLEVWVARGIIVKMVKENACSGACAGCYPEMTKYYQYNEQR